jgi:hypothetical protein
LGAGWGKRDYLFDGPTPRRIAVLIDRSSPFFVSNDCSCNLKFSLYLGGGCTGSSPFLLNIMIRNSPVCSRKNILRIEFGFLECMKTTNHVEIKYRSCTAGNDYSFIGLN